MPQLTHRYPTAPRNHHLGTMEQARCSGLIKQIYYCENGRVENVWKQYTTSHSPHRGTKGKFAGSRDALVVVHGWITSLNPEGNKSLSWFLFRLHDAVHFTLKLSPKWAFLRRLGLVSFVFSFQQAVP